MLLAAARGDEPPPLGDAGAGGWERLARAAGTHGVQGWLARSLRGRPGVPPAFQIPLQATALKIAASHRKLLGQAEKVLGLLEPESTVVLKGPALVERHYGDATLRSYGDLDVLVRPRDFVSSLAALEAAGYVLSDRNWDFLVQDLRGQVHLMSPTGADTVELHWHLVNASRQRRMLRMGPEEGWDAVEPARLGDAQGLVLVRDAEVAHLALHAAMHGCNRLVWLLDIAAVARGDVDWDRVEARLRRWRFGTGGGFVLSLAARWVGAAVPPEVLRSLVKGRVTRAAYERVVRSWDLGNDTSEARELFFVSAADGLATRAALAGDAIVPARGQQPGGRAGIAYRATAGAYRRVRAKLTGDDRPEALAEYVPTGDHDEGRRRFSEAVTGVATRRVLLVSPSSSIGMSHYTHALASAIGGAAQTELVDAADGARPARVVTRWWGGRGRDTTRVLVTSPHWSMPLLLAVTGWSGGFVWHDPILDAASPAMKPLHELYYKLLTKKLGTVVLHGSVFRHHVDELGLPAREVLVVPHGFVPDQLVPDTPYDPAGPLVFAGRLHPYKGLGVLLRALDLLGDAAPPVVAGGDGITRELIPGSLASVEVRPGELPDDELRELIGSCSALLLPYERANQSGVLAHAFRSGRPVIASRVGSFAEYVHDGVNGLLVPPGDPAALAAAMTKLRDDPDLARRLAAGALKTWEEELSPPRWGREIVDALFR